MASILMPNDGHREGVDHVGADDLHADHGVDRDHQRIVDGEQTRLLDRIGALGIGQDAAT